MSNLIEKDDQLIINNELRKKKKKLVGCICGDVVDIMVGLYEANYKYLPCCKDKGYKNPDKRSNGTANETRKKTLQDKYGVENAAHIDGVKEKKIQTNEERYGGIGFASDELAEKTRSVIKDKYGAENIMQTEETKKMFSGKHNVMSKLNPQSIERRKKVSKKLSGRKSKLKDKSYDEIHGDEKSKELKKHKSEKLKEKYQPNLHKIMDYLNLELLDEDYKGAHHKHNWACTSCNTKFEQLWNKIQQGFQCPQCFPRNMEYSKSELEIREFIEDMGFSPIYNSKTIIYPKEIDIFIPEKNLAIEHNGIYFHSVDKVGKDYHVRKTEECYKKGIRLIHIFEDEWVLKNDIVKERLKYILGCSNSSKIHGRKCDIKEISTNEKDEFLNNYHIQGTDIASSVRLGAFYDNELVAVMTFSKQSAAKGRKHIEGFWELNRFCSDPKYIIYGIAGKLLKYFQRNYKWDSIISYADRRWSTGDLYEKLSFKFIGFTPLDYWYSKGSLERISRYKMRKRSDEPKDIPEYILRAKDGYFRVYGCGHYKFVMENDRKTDENNAPSQ